MTALRIQGAFGAQRKASIVRDALEDQIPGVEWSTEGRHRVGQCRVFGKMPDGHVIEVAVSGSEVAVAACKRACSLVEAWIG